MEYLILIGAVVVVAYLVGRSNSDRNISSTQMQPVRPDPVINVPAAKPIPKLNVSQADISNIELSDEQQKVFRRLTTTTSNYYITGKAGTGKSVLLQMFVAQSNKSVVVVAPTGVAALNVGGQTIHSLFRLPPEHIDLQQLTVDHRLRAILQPDFDSSWIRGSDFCWRDNDMGVVAERAVYLGV